MNRFSRRGMGSLMFGVVLLDFLCFQLSLVIGYWLWIAYPWHGNYQSFAAFALILWILPPTAVFVFKAVGLYKPEMGVMGVQEQSLIFNGVWLVYVMIFAMSFFYRGVSFSRLATFYSFFISLILISFERYLIRQCFEWLYQKEIGVRYAVIYGAGHQGQRLERWIRQSPKLGIRVAGFLDDDTDRLTKKPEALPLLGGIAEIGRIAAEQKASLLFVAHRGLEETRILDIFQHCREHGIECWVIPSLYRFHVERIRFMNIGGIPLVGFSESFSWRSYFFIKRILDVILSAGFFVFLLPVALAITLLIRMTSKDQDVFFKQVRVGLRGKPFTMYKFRTLSKNYSQSGISPELGAEAGSITPFAAFLRRSGLDEIPQLWNVLKGDMSLIGPRPEMPFITEHYGPLEKERLTIRPGITGLWQISDDRKRLMIHENMDYDLYYVENLSFSLDLAIMLKTVLIIVRRMFAVKDPVRQKSEGTTNV